MHDRPSGVPPLSMRAFSAAGSRMASGFPPTPVGYSSEEERHHVRIFVRKVLEAFVASSEYGKSKFNISADSDPSHSWDIFFRAQRPDLGGSVVLERSIKQLCALHRTCIAGVADHLARLLLPDNRLRSATRRARITAALSEDANATGFFPAGLVNVNVPEAFRTLQIAATKFHAQVSPIRKGSFEDSATEPWAPDWRCQNLVWDLIKRLGDISAPPILQAPYQELKESMFACLFEREYIDKQWLQCSFRRTFLRYIPRPYNWDADLSWIGVSFFVAMPLTGFVQELYNNLSQNDGFLDLRLFWGTFFGIFFATSFGMVLYYSAYRSQYSTRLMQRAAVGTSYETKYADSAFAPGPLLKRLSSVPMNLTGKLSPTGKRGSQGTDDSDTLDAADLDTIITEATSRLPSPGVPEAATPRSGNPSSSAPAMPSNVSPMEIEAVMPKQRHRSLDKAYFNSADHVLSQPNGARAAMCPDRAIGFGDDEAGSGLTGATLRLYQASMFVQRIYGSTYFDESWAFGLSESQLRDAVKLMLQTDSSLGRQYAAFSFAAIAVASRGVQINPTPQPQVMDISQFNFGIFSFLGALSFVSGITSAVLADLILRQMSFTQISREGTAHGFVERFGFFIRVVGGLNSSAGMFLSTAVLHFLMSIFKVNPYAVIALGATWLILGTMVSDSFFANYHFWRMSEILDDVTLIAEPDVLSPSPITGALQFVMGQLRKFTFPKRRERRAQAP